MSKVQVIQFECKVLHLAELASLQKHIEGCFLNVVSHLLVDTLHVDPVHEHEARVPAAALHRQLLSLYQAVCDEPVYDCPNVPLGKQAQLDELLLFDEPLLPQDSDDSAVVCAIRVVDYLLEKRRLDRVVPG